MEMRPRLIHGVAIATVVACVCGVAPAQDALFTRISRPTTRSPMWNHLRDDSRTFLGVRLIDDRNVNVVVGSLVRHILATVHAFRALLWLQYDQREVETARRLPYDAEKMTAHSVDKVK